MRLPAVPLAQERKEEDADGHPAQVGRAVDRAVLEAAAGRRGARVSDRAVKASARALEGLEGARTAP